MTPRRGWSASQTPLRCTSCPRTSPRPPPPPRRRLPPPRAPPSTYPLISCSASARTRRETTTCSAACCPRRGRTARNTWITSPRTPSTCGPAGWGGSPAKRATTSTMSGRRRRCSRSWARPPASGRRRSASRRPCSCNWTRRPPRPSTATRWGSARRRRRTSRAFAARSSAWTRSRSKSLGSRSRPFLPSAMASVLSSCGLPHAQVPARLLPRLRRYPHPHRREPVRGETVRRGAVGGARALVPLPDRDRLGPRAGDRAGPDAARRALLRRLARL
mmetsp:Transcript_31231/g.104332  ORF Transcript_31231/g.104332 Transcript_31231/m.104332 type:complete len:275 (+) Transcript_31231:3215-4039(+)